jgi:hypothetical protein
MNKEWVDGFEQIEKAYGYWPSFHDDTIEKIEIDSEGIRFYIVMEKVPTSMGDNPIIKMAFGDVNEFCLEGEILGCASIILDIETEKNGDIIETKIASSLGAKGMILSKSIEINFCNIKS